MVSDYDTIGINYSDLRRPDPRIAAPIARALGSAASVLNVGAGAGSYEPGDRPVTALEPSIEMIRQRRAGTAPAIQGRAEELPFEDGSFDASMAILTVHHWADQAKGVGEMRRVARDRIVILTCDPAFGGFWLMDYLPELRALDAAKMPAMAQFEQWLGPLDIAAVPIPHDCIDGFLCAYWRRPAAYLDPRVRAAISPFWVLGDISEGLGRLEKDLESGAWARRYAHLLDRSEIDCGYRLLVAT